MFFPLVSFFWPAIEMVQLESLAFNYACTYLYGEWAEKKARNLVLVF